MRAVNSILVAAGNLRLKVGDDPLWNEAKIVLRSVMDVNLPKFTVDDLPLFRGITSDLFPGIELPQADHGALIATIDEICLSGVTVAPERTFKLEPVPSFTLKIQQLYEMVLVRHGQSDSLAEADRAQRTQASWLLAKLFLEKRPLYTL